MFLAYQFGFWRFRGPFGSFLALFVDPIQKKADFCESWKFKFFQIFIFKMALMGSHGKNNKFFMIFGPLPWLVSLWEAFVSLRYDFQGDGYLGGIEKMNFWFLAKIH